MNELLTDFKVINIGYNLPSPLAASKLSMLGAKVLKIEPPTGDPLQQFCAEWYEELTINQEVIRLDLKTPDGQEHLHSYMENCDLLMTSGRLSSLTRLGLSWDQLHKLYPNMCMISIIGFSPPDDEQPGHDLTYQSKAGLIIPPEMPKTLLADTFGSERVVQTALGLLLKRSLTGRPSREVIALSDALIGLAAPQRHGLTTPDGFLGGKQARYNLYSTQKGWIAVAALEEKFWTRLQHDLGIYGQEISKKSMEIIFNSRTAIEWESWAQQRKLPIAVVKELII
jgi:crotonobetainyl-CoA:carnitine CoA-transferase CaiB-like acyl-CoA transferase